MMSCAKIDDLQDLAQNLFDYDQEQPRLPRKERTLKKQRKVKANSQQPVEQEKEEQMQERPILQKAPGTHSVYVKTFGCSHNISDSEFMVGQLAQYGYQIVDNATDADLVLINSCTVVNPSQDAFISMVAKAKRIKKPIVVAGCVPQGDSAIPELADISAVGVTQIDRIVEVVEQTLKGHKVQLLTKKGLPSLDLPKIRKNKDIEIIAINAGCLGACTYCKTVFARGKLISYSPDVIVERVRAVAREGVKQIWLTSEDTGAYGRDIGSNISELLVKLCEQMEHHKGIMMRIGMTNPPYMLDQLSSIAHFLKHPRVFAFIHIPIQAAHNTVLQKMNRQYTVQEFREVTDYFLKHVPDVTVATDIICGFAEETEQQFEASLELIREYKFRVVNINQFYLRPGTPASNLKQLPTKIVKNRSSRLTDLFRSIDKHGYMVGRQERVWINEEETHKGQHYLVGHTKNYTKVIIPFRKELLYKEVIMKVTKAFDWHIEGEIIDQNPACIQVLPNLVQEMKKDIIEERQRIQNRKQAKILKMKQKKQKLIKERLERGEQIVRVREHEDDDHHHHHEQNKKTCCQSKQKCKCEQGGCGSQSCCSKKEIQSKSSLSTQMKSEKLEEIKEIKQKNKIETVHYQKNSQPIFLIIACLFLAVGVGLLLFK